MVFNKTPVIIQRLSPSFLSKKRVTFQKTHVFQLSIFASSFWVLFCGFHGFGGVLQKHLFHQSVGPLGLSLRPNLATARAREGQSPPCFPCSWTARAFLTLYMVLKDLGHILGAFFQIVRRLLVPSIGKTTTQRHNERRNDKTTKQRTTKRPNDQTPK